MLLQVLLTTHDRQIPFLAAISRSAGYRIGINVIRRAGEEPVRQISGNGGYESLIVVEKIRAEKSANFGFNVATGVYEEVGRYRSGQGDSYGTAARVRSRD